MDEGRSKEMEDRRAEAHKIVRDAFEKAGIVDGFYAGILIDGDDISSYTFGNPMRAEYSNIVRYQRLLGCVESCKYMMMKSAHDRAE